ncbi:hypothetical protein HV823_24415 [Rhizobium sp. DBTS2]|uniref:Uncharacterized protein n=1 Tax=Mycoplana rhizolycopersici TaxID=2746702 RepID=A0ABX2QP99_9HYPH|nr:hypothetical protein [Rhizobium rhizolycopersici]
MAKELAERGITANTVAPGAIETDFLGGAVHYMPDLNMQFGHDCARSRGRTRRYRAEPARPRQRSLRRSGLLIVDIRMVTARQSGDLRCVPRRPPSRKSQTFMCENWLFNRGLQFLRRHCCSVLQCMARTRKPALAQLRKLGNWVLINEAPN